MTDIGMALEPETQRKASFGEGMARGCLLHLLLIPMAFVAAYVGTFYDRAYGIFAGLFVAYWGPFAQLLYQVPAAIRYYRRGEGEAAKGIVVVTVISALACVPCWILWLRR